LSQKKIKFGSILDSSYEEYRFLKIIKINNTSN
jgi:hypothetical protein